MWSFASKGSPVGSYFSTPCFANVDASCFSTISTPSCSDFSVAAVFAASASSPTSTVDTALPKLSATSSRSLQNPWMANFSAASACRRVRSRRRYDDRKFGRGSENNTLELFQIVPCQSVTPKTRSTGFFGLRVCEPLKLKTPDGRHRNRHPRVFSLVTRICSSWKRFSRIIMAAATGARPLADASVPAIALS